MDLLLLGVGEKQSHLLAESCTDTKQSSATTGEEGHMGNSIPLESPHPTPYPPHTHTDMHIEGRVWEPQRVDVLEC